MVILTQVETFSKHIHSILIKLLTDGWNEQVQMFNRLYDKLKRIHQNEYFVFFGIFVFVFVFVIVW